MQNVKEKIRFYLSASLYLLFNLRIAATFQETMIETFWQILQTAPFIAGFTYVIISVLQYMGDGSKIPWDRRPSSFFCDRHNGWVDLRDLGICRSPTLASNKCNTVVLVSVNESLCVPCTSLDNLSGWTTAVN